MGLVPVPHTMYLFSQRDEAIITALPVEPLNFRQTQQPADTELVRLYIRSSKLRDPTPHHWRRRHMQGP